MLPIKYTSQIGHTGITYWVGPRNTLVIDDESVDNVAVNLDISHNEADDLCKMNAIINAVENDRQLCERTKAALSELAVIVHTMR